MQHSDIEFIHAFSSHGLYLVEVKRTDLPAEAAKEDKYFWLRWQKETNVIERLQFVSLENDDGLEIREFSDGVLTFDNAVGEYLLHNGDGVALDRISKGNIEKATKKVFFDYLQKTLSR